MCSIDTFGRLFLAIIVSCPIFIIIGFWVYFFVCEYEENKGKPDRWIH